MSEMSGQVIERSISFIPRVDAAGKIAVNGELIDAKEKTPNRYKPGDALVADRFGSLVINEDYPEGMTQAVQGIYLNKGLNTNGIDTIYLGDFESSINCFASNAKTISGGDFDQVAAEQLRAKYGFPLRYPKT